METRLKTLVGSFSQAKFLVVGDYFIDQYLDLSRELSEVSLETGLEAYQVVTIRNQLGAAGNIANNLRVLGAQVGALTLTGCDANGFVMHQLLRERNIDTRGVIQAVEVYTPTYIKPLMKEKDHGTHELNRFDIKNRHQCPVVVQQQLLDRLYSLVPEYHGVLVMDQVQEQGCGVVGAELRTALGKIAQISLGTQIWVDSREQGSKFSGVALKTNLREAKKILGLPEHADLSAEEAARQVFLRNGKPVVVTAGEQGVYYHSQSEQGHVPALKLAPPIDVVGAGDAVLSALGCALCSGGSLREAAFIGTLAASVVVKKIGTTGSSSPEEILCAAQLFQSQYPEWTL